MSRTPSAVWRVSRTASTASWLPVGMRGMLSIELGRKQKMLNLYVSCGPE